MRKTLLIVVFLLMLSTSVLADYSCINDTYSQFSTTLTVSNSTIPISYDEYCPFNCTNATGECNSNPYNSSDLDFFILIAIAIILFVIGNSLNEEDWPIHFMFLIASLILIVASLGLLVSRETAMGNVLFSGTMLYVYYFAIVILLVIIFYYIVKTALKVLYATSKVK